MLPQLLETRGGIMRGSQSTPRHSCEAVAPNWRDEPPFSNCDIRIYPVQSKSKDETNVQLEEF